MIITIPNPVLSKPAKKVVRVDKKVQTVIKQMKMALVTANKPKGIGLAAPQIEVPLQIFITKPSPDASIKVFINPKITHYSEEKSEIQRDSSDKSLKNEKKLEGCLSIKNVWGYLKRSKKVMLSYMNEQGETKREEFGGFMSTIVQHETDHINGILFTQRVLEQNEKLYRIEKNAQGEEKLIEIEI